LNLGRNPGLNQLNESFATEKRDGTLRAIQDSKNKAMMHDVDLRFENQDRMINYLVSQIQGFEGQTLSTTKRANELSEKERADS